MVVSWLHYFSYTMVASWLHCFSSL